MSRHTVNNQRAMELIATKIFTNPANPGYRKIVWLENVPEHWIESLANLVDGEAPFNPCACADRADRITHLLGNEHAFVIHQVHDPMDAGLLSAITGTVTAGGLLLIALDWPSTTNRSACSRDNRETLQPAPVTRFNQRFYQLLKHYENQYPDLVHQIVLDDSDGSEDDIALPLANAIKQSLQSAKTANPARLQAHRQQNVLLTRACEFLENNGTGYVTLTGQRGRGKSALLARIANWLHDQRIDYAVTAASTSALSSFQKHVRNPANVVRNPSGINNRVASVLLVDEAANLSLTILKQLIIHHERVIFCTTVEGYESAGRAFDTRFLESIKAGGAPHINLSPTVSWRWREGDPLELLINELGASASAGFADQAAAPVDSRTRCSSDSRVTVDNIGPTISEVTQQQLCDDEPLLRKVFHLLRATHYQTSMQDLQHLLDGKDVRLWVLHTGSIQTLAGVVLLGIEGQIDDNLHQAIVDKRRRLPHQLLPQLLAQMANTPAALNERYARVIRISIATPFRQQGLGSDMLSFIESQIRSDAAGPIRTLGASFATDPISEAFWRANGYSEFHRGFRRNPRTGLQSVAVLKTSDKNVEVVRQQAARIHEENQLWHRQEAAAANIGGEVHVTNSSIPQGPLDEDRILLEQFARGHRSAHDTYAALCKLAEQDLICLPSTSGQSSNARDKLLRKRVTALVSEGLL